MRFLRTLSENNDRTVERSREGKEPEGEEVVGERVVGGGEGTTADEDGVAEGSGAERGRRRPGTAWRRRRDRRLTLTRRFKICLRIKRSRR